MNSLETPSTSLFVIAHPDDELLFAHTIQARASQPGSTAHILVATNGEASTVDLKGDGFVMRGGREQEARRSLGTLGIPDERQYYRGLTDGSLDFEVATLAGTIARLTMQHGIDTIYTFDETGYDNHLDHVSTYRAAMILSGRLSVQHIVRTRDAADADIIVSGQEEDKLTVIRNHASQFDVSDRELVAYMTDEYNDGLTDEYYRQAA